MARIRTVKPEFFTSDDVVALQPLARLLFVGLWCEADREGRMVWAPKAFKRRYLPEDDCDVELLCDELVKRRMVVLYGDGFAFIPTFSKHQHVNPREALSTLPSPSDHASGTRIDASVTRREEGKEREGKEQKEGKRTRAKAQKSTIPDDWKADDELIAYAREQGCKDPHDTFERFRLHHAGKGTEHKDWSLAAKYWARNEKNFLPSRPGTTGPRMQTMAAPQPEDWAWKVKWHRDKGMWNAAWGPEPGQPGCFVPKDLLQ